MKTWLSAVALTAWLCQTANAQLGDATYQSLTVYVTPADIDLMRRTADGLLTAIPIGQLGRVKDVIVVLDSSGSPGTPLVLYRPDDPEYRNRPLPVLAAEFDDASLRQLANAPLGMVFEAPPEAIGKITHVNLRVAPSLLQSNTAGSSVLENGMPPRQSSSLGSAAPNRDFGFGGLNLENGQGANQFGSGASGLSNGSAANSAPALGYQFNNIGAASSQTNPSGLANWNGGANFNDAALAPSTNGRNAPNWSQQNAGTLTPVNPRANSGVLAESQSPAWQRNNNPSPLDPQFGNSPANASAWGTSANGLGALPNTTNQQIPTYQNDQLVRRDAEDRLAMNQMQSYLYDLESRLAQLSGELQVERSKRRLEEQVTAGSSLPQSQPATHPVSSALPTADPGQETAGALPRINGFLWFMLLCSIGINLYLSWISRGFYMRYNELADELRETFAAANS